MHIPVLLHEAIDGLFLKKGETVVDGTLGGAGHSLSISKIIGGNGTLIGIDEDEEAIERSKKVLSDFKGELHLVRGNFRNIEKIISDLGVKKVNKIIFDLGVSTYHYETSERGFSFKRDEPLKMTLGKNPSGHFSAYEIVNEWDEENLKEIIRGYGEEEFSGRIARVICQERKIKPIKTSKELASIVEKAVPAWYRHRKIHPATKTFQAIRIAVNDELKALEEGLTGAENILNKGGRIAVISFHSLEDRIVKNFFRKMDKDGRLKIITKKPIVPSEKEIRENGKSRSAKLRIAQKL